MFNTIYVNSIGRPVKEYQNQRSNVGNVSRQRNGVVNEQPPPNAWRASERKPTERREKLVLNEVKSKTVCETPNAWRVLKKKPIERNEIVATNEEKSYPFEPPTREFELVNLADQVNQRERQLRSVPTEEDILKQILGLGQNKSAIMNKVPADVENNSQRIDLNSLFGKTENNVINMETSLPLISSLPKPPQAWHQKSRNNVVNNVPHALQQNLLLQHQQSSSIPPNIPVNVGPQMQHHPFYPPQPPHPSMLPTMNMMQFPPHAVPPHMYRQPLYIPGHNYPIQYPVIPGPQPFIHVQPQHIRMSTPPHHQIDISNRQSNAHYVMHHSPEGPQKLKPKNGTSSAFIPLQAARKSVKVKHDSAKKDVNLGNHELQQNQVI